MIVGILKIRAAAFAVIMLVICYPLLEWATSIPWHAPRTLRYGGGVSVSLAGIMTLLIPIGAYFFHIMIQKAHRGMLTGGSSFLPTEIMLLAIALILNFLIFI